MKLKMRQERERRGWTQGYVGEKLGITAESVSMLESGKRKPSYDVLVKLLDLFDYSDPRELFGAATPSGSSQE